MDNSNTRAEQELERRITKRDEECPSPQERAGYIYNLIKDYNNNITNWDLICFCVEYLATQIAVYDWLEENCIRKLNMIVNQAHYLRDEIPETGVK